MKKKADQTGHLKKPEPFTRVQSLIGALVMAVFMFVSRILGFFRDVNTAAVMGMSGSVVMDAFVCAFRIPNLARRLFEEGVFGLAYIPILAQYRESDPRKGNQLVAAFLWRGALLGLIAVLAGELTILANWLIFTPAVGTLWNTALYFAALMFPYLLFVIPAAQCAATLQGLGRFGIAGLMPTLLNLFWLAALWVISPFGIYLPFRISTASIPFLGKHATALALILTPSDRGAILSITIVVASIAQFLLQYGWLRHLGADSTFFARCEISAEIRREILEKIGIVFRKMILATASLLFLQINTLLATILATLFTAKSIPCLSIIPGVNALFAGTTQTGAASAIYFGERLYEFPLAFIGITVGTAFYPLLVRHTLEKNRHRFIADLTLGLRLIASLSVPAGIGLALVAEPLSRLLYMRGEFSPDDAIRTGRILILFGSGVPAFCLSALLIRAFVAEGDFRHPMQVGALSTLIFLASALTAVRPAGETGLAAAIVTAAWFQTAVLFTLQARNLSSRHLSAFFKTLAVTLVASGFMAVAIMGSHLLLTVIDASFLNETGSAVALLHVTADVTVGIIVFACAFFLLGGRTHRQLRHALCRRGKKISD